MDKVIKLYTYNGDGVASTPFPNEEEQVVTSDFEYNANRMGSARSISAKIMHRLCLDNLWSDNVYAEFNGERFFVMNTPSSNKDNDDERYEHDVTLLSEIELLNHVYFIDAVQGDSTEDQQKSNTATVQFFGDVNEFVTRLNACLQYNKLNFNAVVDEGITSDEVLVSFEDKYILESLQEIYNLYEIPYYFNGNTIHVGYTDSVVTYPMKYGFDEALLSISKENANYAIINKIKGIGSSDNIPYYYPNKSPKGDIGIQVPETNVSLKDTDIKIFNAEKFSEVNTNDIFTYKKVSDSTAAEIVNTKIMIGETNEWNGHYLPEGSTLDISFTGMKGATKRFMVIVNVKKACNLYLNLSVKATPKNDMLIVTPSYSFDGWTEGTYVEAGIKEFYFNVGIGVVSSEIDAQNTVSLSLSYDTSLSKTLEWTLNDKKVDLENYGVRLSDSATVSEGDSFSQKMGVLIPSVENLMPSIYRESLGKEQFYEAKNNTYDDGEGGYYEFENEYSENNQRQGTTEFEDIKPTIVGMTNASGQRMDMFLDFAFDENDNDEYDEENNTYVHPYFFAKLPKYDGENGFNLFDHASESGNMTISMTSGTCGACSFEIGVGEKSNQNTVQVDEHGNLLKDENGDIRCGRDGKPAEEPQPRQQDTENYEVWIALKKDDSTYTNIMPNAYHNLKPSTDDTFVILNINLPDAYIYNAEKKLEQALIKYMWENNREKFNFPIKFSRIFFTEHPEVLDELNENSRVLIEYNGQQHTLYVDNFSYKMSSDSPLPEIEINLVDTLTVGKNSLQTQLDSVKQDILSSIGGGDFLKQGLKYFLRKDVNDYANGKIAFNKGLESKGDVVIGEKGFAGGLVGFGAKIGKDGRAEMRSLTLWESLEVPELRYNSVKVFLGVDWQVAGAGIIESCTPDKDENGDNLSTGTCTLKLEEGQYGAVDVDDIALGIWHFGNENDDTADTDDGKGGFTFAGFATSYFRITNISGENNKTFRYSLRPGYDIHPQPQMTFACYGNFTNIERQKSTYRTRTYTRRLWNQNTWEIGIQNIAAQDGDLSNLSIFGLDMTGYSAYLNSIYFTGEIKQVKPDGTPVLTANDRGSWGNDTQYYFYDRVSHNGSIWLCVNEDGTDTEPSESNPNWLLEVSKGDAGADGTSFNILGSKDEPSQLPQEGNNIGDAYIISGDLWVWTGDNEWKNVGNIQGPAGESVQSMGTWYNGLFVPYLGVVRMGNATFMCTNKEGTYNPPYYTLIDNDGNRIKAAVGYIITGEINNAEYQLIAQDGVDGKDGKDGQDGLQGIQGEKGEQGIQGEKGEDGKDGVDGQDGKQGIDGCVVRDSEWTIGTEYRNDSNITDGSLPIRYIDVVLVRNDAVETGWDAYRCKLTHVASSSITYNNTSYWEKFGLNVGAIFTSLIIAKNAKIQLFQGNDLLIQKDNGTVTAGMTGSNSGSLVRIFAGSTYENRASAPFRVTESGEMYATKAHIQGEVVATSGSFSGELKGATGTFTGSITAGDANGERIIIDSGAKSIGLISGNLLLSYWEFFNHNGFKSCKLTLLDNDYENVTIYPHEIGISRVDLSAKLTPSSLTISSGSITTSIGSNRIYMSDGSNSYIGFTGTAEYVPPNGYSKTLYFRNGICYKIS